MQFFSFATRTEARAYPLGTFRDMGPEAPKGERYGRTIPGLSGSARQRRKTVRAMLRDICVPAGIVS